MIPKAIFCFSMGNFNGKVLECSHTESLLVKTLLLTSYAHPTTF